MIAAPSRRAEIVALSVAAICAGLAIADVVFGPWDRDGGFYLLQATYTAAGVRPYLDYHLIYPPLMNLLDAPFVALPVSRLSLAIALPAIWIAANGAATAFLAWTVTRNRVQTTLMTGLFFAYCIENGGNHLTLEHGVMLFAMLALALVLDTRPFSPGRLAWAGLAASAACLCKQNGAIVLLPIAAVLLTRRETRALQPLAAFAAGFALLPLAVLTWLGFKLSAIYQNLWLDALGYAEATLPDTGWRNEISRAPGTVVLFFVAGVAALTVAARNRKLLLLCGATLVSAILEFLPRVIRNYPHYNLNIWPFLALLLLLALAHFATREGALTTAGLQAAVLVYSLTLALQHFQTGTPPLVRLNVAATTLRSATPPEAPVRQYGSEPILEFLAGRSQERTDLPTSVWTRWDGSGIYRMPPPSNATVVVVDRGQPWVAPVMQQLSGAGFTPVTPALDAGGAIGRIAILRRQR